MTITKLDVADIDGYDWNWYAKYVDEVAAELAGAYLAAFVAAFPDRQTAIVQRQVGYEEELAAEYGRQKAESELNAIAEETKGTVRTVIQRALNNRHPIGRIINLITFEWIFSVVRAARIARTQAANALGQGTMGAAVVQGRDEKQWYTQGDDAVTDECLSNEGEGWIPIGNNFSSGVMTVPQHPNCRCTVGYRTSELGTGLEIPFFGTRPRDRTYEPAILGDFRCSGCKRLLGRDVHPGTRIHCRHCKEERTA
jgi:hypothetical protein